MDVQLVPVYLGVDGGSSGTRAILVDERCAILGFGTGGSANHGGQGYNSAAAHIAHAVREACATAYISHEAVHCAHFALAGDDVEDDQVQLTERLTAAFPGLRFEVTNDVWAGLRAGSLAGYGIATNCGSGAGAVGCTPDGARAIIPDLGYVFGDSGGGVQIGVDAVRSVVRAWDGRGAPTMLTEAVLALTELASTEDLYLALYRGQVPDQLFRKCTKLVFQAAARGDAEATRILTRVGDEFGLSAVAIARRLHMEEIEFPYVLTGGAVRTLESPLVAAATARLRTVCARFVPALPRLMPVAGAALLALDSGQEHVTEEHFEYLREQGQGWHAVELF